MTWLSLRCVNTKHYTKRKREPTHCCRPISTFLFTKSYSATDFSCIISIERCVFSFLENKFNLNDWHSLAENMFRQFVLLFTWCIFLISADYSGFDDSVLFKLNWPGQDETLLVKRFVLFKFKLFHVNSFFFVQLRVK